MIAAAALVMLVLRTRRQDIFAAHHCMKSVINARPKLLIFLSVALRLSKRRYPPSGILPNLKDLVRESMKWSRVIIHQTNAELLLVQLLELVCVDSVVFSAAIFSCVKDRSS